MGRNQTLIGQRDMYVDGGRIRRDYHPAMSEEIGVKEDVSVLVILELSVAESGVGQMTVKERWEWCFRRREQCTRRPRGERDMAVWH